jgi:hypothetical protein
MSTQRPFAISALVVVQFVFALACFYVAFSNRIPVRYPDWLFPWGTAIASLQAISAIALWRLNWFGPLSFVVLWFCPLVATFVLSRNFLFLLHSSMVWRLTALVVYLAVVYFYRDRFASNHSLKQSVAE